MSLSVPESGAKLFPAAAALLCAACSPVSLGSLDNGSPEGARDASITAAPRDGSAASSDGSAGPSSFPGPDSNEASDLEAEAGKDSRDGMATGDDANETVDSPVVTKTDALLDGAPNDGHIESSSADGSPPCGDGVHTCLPLPEAGLRDARPDDGATDPADTNPPSYDGSDCLCDAGLCFGDRTKCLPTGAGCDAADAQCNEELPDATDDSAFPRIPPPDVAAWEPRAPSADRPLTAISPCGAFGPCFAGYSDGQIFLRTGSSWLRVDQYDDPNGPYALPRLFVSALTVSPVDQQRVYVGYSSTLPGTTTMENKIWVSGSGGHYWMELQDSPIDDVWALSVNPIDSDFVYAVTSNGVYRSPDNGTHWYSSRITNDPLMQRIAPDAGSDGSAGVCALAYGRSSREAWVATEPDDGLYYSADTSRGNWVKLPIPIPHRRLRALAARERGDELPELWVVFHDSQEGAVWMTNDNGQTWASKHRPSLPDAGAWPFVTIVNVSVNPVFPSTLYAIGRAIAYRTDDSGEHWYQP